MKLQSQSYLKVFKKLTAVMVTGMVLVFTGCGGGGGGGGSGGNTGSPPGGVTVKETMLYSFAGTTDGSSPQAGLIQASDGNFYGMTSTGGTNNMGTVFKIVTDGTSAGTTETVLYSFAGGTDGANPYGSLIQASDGNLYGMTANGGTGSFGTVFKIVTDGTPAGTTETVLYSFAGGTDGAYPNADLVQASDGNLYGMTPNGGTNNVGTVFKVTLTPAVTETVLYSFALNTNGLTPQGNLIQASDGNFYGMTVFGGGSLKGAVFKIVTNGTPAGTTETVLHSFSVTDGANPYGSLIQASDGKLYGMTSGGGSGGSGTMFCITTAGTFTLLHSFGTAATFDGVFPLGNLIQASDGNLYGMTAGAGGGTSGWGTVFKVVTNGTQAGTTVTVLHSFAGATTDGSSPNYGNLIQASDGNFYGMTLTGGANDLGTVFKIP